MTVTPTPTAVDVLTRARDVATMIAARAADAEQLRRLPDDVAAAVQQAGLHRILQPARRGGSELDIRTHVQASAVLSRACPSTGWVVAVYGMHNWAVALFPEQAQEDLWQDSSVFSQASFAPLGRATPAPGGYRVSGRWPFASGIDHAAWSLLSARIDDAAPGGPPNVGYFLAPRSDVQVVDTWHVAGLKGTGSKDVVVEEVFVPAHRALSARAADAGEAPGLAVHPAPLYRNPFTGMLVVALVGPAIGAAEGAVAAFTEHVRRRVLVMSGTRQAEFAPTRLDLAEAAAAAHAARLLAERVCDDLTAAGEAGRPAPALERARYGRDCAFALQLATRAVDIVMAASGGGALQDSNAIQRYWRDVHAVGAHAALSWQTRGDAYGAAALAAEPADAEA